MSSLKMTFSLTSLILIFAMAFAVMPAMAHLEDTTNRYLESMHDGEDADGNPLTSTTTPTLASETNHTHRAAPTVTNIELVDVKIGATAAARGMADAESTVDGTSVILVDDAVGAADDAAIAKIPLDDTVAGQFRIKITFSEAVYLPAEAVNVGPVGTAADTDLAAASILDVASSQAAPTVRIDALTASEIARDGTAATTFLATIGVPAANTSGVPMDVWLSVAQDAVFSKGRFVPPNDIHGRGNDASAQQKFTIVSEFTVPEAPPDTTPPTVEITPPEMPDSDGNLVFTLTFSEELGTGLDALTRSDIDITGGDAMDADLVKDTTDPKVYTLTVTPDMPDSSVTISIRADSVADAAGHVLMPDDTTMATYDKSAPVAMISSAPGTGTDAGKVIFTIDFDEALGDGLTVTDLEVSNANALRLADLEAVEVDAMMEPDVAMRYMLTVTPVDPTMPVTLTIKAGTVADMNMNRLDLTQSTYMPPAADTTPPTVTITMGTQDGRSLPITITVADDVALASDAEIVDSEITVTGGEATAVEKGAGPDAGTYALTVTINYDVTSVTVAVAASAVMDTSNNASAAASMMFTVTATPMPIDEGPTDAANILSGLTIPAETHVVIARSGAMGLPSGVTPVIWDGMPDLENLFFSGGTLNVTRAKTPKVDHDNDDPDADGKKADGKDASATRDIGTRDVVITEIMAAVNTATPDDADARIAHQWIEVYNKLKVEVGGITISTKAAHPAGFPAGAPTDQVLLDRFSDVVDRGWKFENLGSNGSYDGDPETTDSNFVSFYRNNRGEPGWQQNRWTTSTNVYLAGHVGTPGAKERAAVTVLDQDTLTQKPAIINEVGNFPTANKDYEWVEILVTDGTHRFKNWEVEIVTAAKTIKRVFTLPEIPDAQKIGKDGILLVTSTDPAKDPDHPLAPGYNVMENDADQARGVSSDHPVRYIVRNFENELPSGEFVLVLRTRNDRDNHEGIADVAGYHSNLKVDETNFFTNLWPLRGFGAPASNKNQLSEGEVHYRQHASVVGTGTTHGDKKDDQVAMRGASWTGIGYKRNAAATKQNGGTPGYANGALKSEGTDAISAVVISEIMYDASRNLPQWIELQNMSKSAGVNIDNWSLFVVNHGENVDGTDYIAGELVERIDLDGKIPPGQTFLIVSTGNRGDTRLPAERIHNLRRGRGAKLLNPNGFRIQLKAKTNEADANKHELVDDVGNLPDKPANTRRADAQAFMDLVWELPSGTTEDGDRVSISRRTSDKIVNSDGTSEWSWMRSDEDPRLNQMHQNTWYGHASDIASPGQTVGSVLPVSLSKFRPERLKDTGEVVVRWITESELNNAGFNILRSDTRDGEFTKVHFVAGQGTTSERTAYEWKDKSAKPNVVYYYQIQDVSLDGDVTTLRTTHLRGNVTAAGKLTTTWGELKALR